MAKDRGIEHIDKVLGDFSKLVEKKIKKKGKVKILEAGCGYGVAMLGLLKKFGDKVEIIGFNYSKKHGDVSKMKEQAVEKKIFKKSELGRMKNLPKIFYLDVDKGLPFKSGSFDFVYSLAAVYLFSDKVKFFEEVNRILGREGVARISPGWFRKMSPERNPLEYQSAWEIWAKGKRVEPYNYFKRIKGVRVGKVGGKPYYLEIMKSPKPNYNLKLITGIDSNFIWQRFMGVKSIYTTQIKFDPHWRS